MEGTIQPDTIEEIRKHFEKMSEYKRYCWLQRKEMERRLDELTSDSLTLYAMVLGDLAGRERPKPVDVEG